MSEYGEEQIFINRKRELVELLAPLEASRELVSKQLVDLCSGNEIIKRLDFYLRLRYLIQINLHEDFGQYETTVSNIFGWVTGITQHLRYIDGLPMD